MVKVERILMNLGLIYFYSSGYVEVYTTLVGQGLSVIYDSQWSKYQNQLMIYIEMFLYVIS